MSVAVARSPVFSPSRIPISCKNSPESLTLGLTQHHHFASSTADDGPSSPYRKFHRAVSGFRIASNEICVSPSSVLNSSGASPSSYSSAATSASPTCYSSSLASKRKRPAQLDIPIMGLLGFDPAPGSDGKREVEEESERYSVYCKRGKKRVEMEDRHSASLNFCGDPQSAFFGVFDGHGGSKAAEYVSKNIGERIMEEMIAREEGRESAGTEMAEAVRKAYLRMDSEFLKEDVGGGTCCVTALLRKGDLIVSNAGDCRAVLSVCGTAEVLTSDHRPSRDDEKIRIQTRGGYVDCCRGVWRLQGCLAVSRSIGDSHLKQWVIPIPETRIVPIKPDSEFLILASDGLWDKVSNQEAIDAARPLCLDSLKPSPLSACKKLVELSISRGSMDDISVMIIQLAPFSFSK